MSGSQAMAMEKENSIVDLGDEDFFQHFNLRKRRFLARGYAGKVYLVTPKSNPKQKWAVKTFSFDSDVKERSMRHFTMEVAVMKSVLHYHLVPCIMAAYCKEYAALVMPYYPGGDITFDGKQDPKEVHRYMSHVALAVEHLHKNNIAHNDIKLENVFLDGSDRAQLGDFGMAVEITNESRTVRAGRLGGTKVYWSPERLEAHRHDRIDPFKADVYSIGVMYWALVSGESPEEDTDYLDRLRTNPDVDLTPAQRSTLERLLEPNPAQRPTAFQAVKLLNASS